MSIQATKLELIKKISNIQSEKLLEHLKEFLQHAEKESYSKQADTLSEEETRLLSAVNEGLPDDLVNRFQLLHKRQREEVLSAGDQKELTQIVDKIEMLEARRLEHLLALADLWDISLEQLRERLGIQAPAPYVW